MNCDSILRVLLVDSRTSEALVALLNSFVPVVLGSRACRFGGGARSVRLPQFRFVVASAIRSGVSFIYLSTIRSLRFCDHRVS